MSAVKAIQTAPCPHCGTLVEGPAGSFCCDGCEMASKILSDAGLESWYSVRERPAVRPLAPAEVAWSEVATVADPEGQRALLCIEGMNCPSCAWVAERLVEREAGVRSVHVSAATSRARVVFDPSLTDLGRIARRIEEIGWRARPADSAPEVDRELMLRFGVAAFCAMNAMGLAVPVYAGWLPGMEPRFLAMFQWCTLAVATPAVLWSSGPFFSGAWRGLRAGVLAMDVPIAIAIALLYGHGLVATFAGQDAYLDSLTMLVALLLGGRMLEARGKKRTLEAAAALAARLPQEARRVRDGVVEVVQRSALVVGDLVEVGPGQEVPADGTVAEGSGEVSLAVRTGESLPLPVGPGARIVGGAVVADGVIRVRVERVGEDGLVAEMTRALVEAREAPLPEVFADRLAPWFTGGTLGVASLTFAAVAATSGVEEAMLRAVAVLVVACPCAVALAQPLTVAGALGAAARQGLLMRSGDGLLRLGRLNRLVLDKTGTLTGGVPEVVGIYPAPQVGEAGLLRIAAGLERASAHPVGRAVVEAAVARMIAIPAATDVRETAGRGIAGVIDGQPYSIGRGGPGEVVVCDGLGAVVGAIRLRDVARGDAQAAMGALKAQGLWTTMLTGDGDEVAKVVGATVGADEIVAGVDPLGKARLVEEWRQNGERVGFVGDGLNDTAALSGADVGIAMGGGVRSALLVADGVIVGGELKSLSAGVAIARACEATVRSSLRRSVVYNLCAVAAAALGFVNPLVAAVLMPLSSGLVIYGALRVANLTGEEPKWTR
jgi:heavy metal translocating P-type ATPase